MRKTSGCLLGSLRKPWDNDGGCVIRSCQLQRLAGLPGKVLGSGGKALQRGLAPGDATWEMLVTDPHGLCLYPQRMRIGSQN